MAARTAHDADDAPSFDRDIVRRIIAQRAQRYLDPGPDLGTLGDARYRLESDRLLIGFARIPLANLDTSCARIASFARARNLRAIWIVMSDLSGPPDVLERALPAHAYVLDERLILMARQGALNLRPNPAVAVSPITTFAAMRAYEYGSRRAFYDDPTPDEHLVAARASERLRQQDNGWFRYYAATLDATIVGGLYISLWEDVPTIMGVYTSDAAQRQGVASAAINCAIDEIRRGGRDAYCLF
ncbi:MAG TPA: GNAT family N-acetyltransferase, partial [Ktedonobacterales bacterium]